MKRRKNKWILIPNFIGLNHMSDDQANTIFDALASIKKEPPDYYYYREYSIDLLWFGPDYPSLLDPAFYKYKRFMKNKIYEYYRRD